ncbi:RteC protein [Sphingobacterium spiritivorum ATCC 33300]|uniref:RteC protein n=1 Tax=Sphingobacterium spiritivorum ATCC 33300 TaxID=525372 RepID=C2G228_SPHSI|nr:MULTISPECIES: RteC domain-containing protein [Bacteroidota]EEI90718.1 RteC protein [Sphingobacterium spiritivorum ATCC 33300]MDM1299391.1 RteC domain-containing protein [Empedobacter falsenii]MDM1319184.1 RteC domain-containing protein [Empedobacter falsenii]OPC67351.1 tetracycline regulation of excision, RteC [Elizabethkingia bruuniana]QQS95611.1 RteC domain-containing protein [Sphingobacterium spiritivorum]
MEKYYNKKILELEAALSELEIESDYLTDKIEIAIPIVIKCLSELKEFVLNNDFKSIQEEINFFKYQKPIIVSKLIYYNTVYKIETKRPYGYNRFKKYFSKELKKLKRFFNSNIEFYKYYRSNNSFLDEKYFLRGKHDIRLWLDTFYFEADHRFSTSHDYKVAKIIANDLIQVYLEDRLNNINVKRGSDNSLKWTASKTALTELIYALYSHGVFNNGNTDIKLIAKTFEEAFNIELGDFYHTFMELKARKINRTKFLDSLCEALIKKMDEKDEK